MRRIDVSDAEVVRVEITRYPDGTFQVEGFYRLVDTTGRRFAGGRLVTNTRLAAGLAGAVQQIVQGLNGEARRAEGL